jgi:hypothetical protein
MYTKLKNSRELEYIGLENQQYLKRKKKVVKVRYDCRGGGANAVPVVLITPGNESTYCLGQLGCDRVCLMKQDYCDVAKQENQKLEVMEKT